MSLRRKRATGRPLRFPLGATISPVKYRPLAIGIILIGLGCSTASDGPPNIVLIISDDHGWPDYGFMGHPTIQTPNLDRLATESMVYTRGYVPAPVCRPSLATLATGLYPHQHKITGNDPPGEWPAVAKDLEARASMERVFARNENVIELLARSGYASHQSGKWWEGNPLDHGFSEALTHGDVTRGGRHGDQGLTIGREGMSPIFDFMRSTAPKREPWKQWFVEPSARPFFIWYAPFLPHTPHDPPERLLAKYRVPNRPERIARYHAMVEWLDETIGQLLDYLDGKGSAQPASGFSGPSEIERLRNTVVLYVADNGWITSEDEADQPTARAKMSPYEMGVRTPIMIRWPGKVEPGRDERTLVSSIDLAPTMLHAAGIEPPPNLPGISLLDREELRLRKQVFGATFAHTAVNVLDPVANLKYRTIVREDGWKLVLPYTLNKDVMHMVRGAISDWMRLDPELYNVLDDPHETKDLAAERPDLVEELRGTLQNWWLVPNELPDSSSN